MILRCINCLFLLVSPSFWNLFFSWRRERWGLKKRKGLKPTKQNYRVCPEMWRQTEGLACSERWPALDIICTAPFCNNLSSWNTFYFFYKNVILISMKLILESRNEVASAVDSNSSQHSSGKHKFFDFILTFRLKITGYELQIRRIWDIYMIAGCAHLSRLDYLIA